MRSFFSVSIQLLLLPVSRSTSSLDVDEILLLGIDPAPPLASLKVYLLPPVRLGQSLHLDNQWAGVDCVAVNLDNWLFPDQQGWHSCVFLQVVMPEATDVVSRTGAFFPVLAKSC